MSKLKWVKLLSIIGFLAPLSLALSKLFARKIAVLCFYSPGQGQERCDLQKEDCMRVKKVAMILDREQIRPTEFSQSVIFIWLAQAGQRSEYCKLFARSGASQAQQLRSFPKVFQQRDRTVEALDLILAFDALASEVEVHMKNRDSKQVLKLCKDALAFVECMLDEQPSAPLYYAWKTLSKVKYTVYRIEQIMYERSFGQLAKAEPELYAKFSALLQKVGYLAYARNCWYWARICFEQSQYPSDEIKDSLDNDQLLLDDPSLRMPTTGEQVLRLLRWTTNFHDKETSVVQTESCMNIDWADSLRHLPAHPLLSMASRMCFEHAEYDLAAYLCEH